MKVALLFLIATIAAQNGKCPNADKYCLSCNSASCLSCVNAYLSSGQCVAPTTKVANCVTYLANNVCSSCAPGYVLSSPISCTKSTIANCVAELASVCISCDAAKKPAADGKSCSTTACTDANCKYCSVSAGIETCAVCNTGYAYDMTTFKCVAEKVANCAFQTGSTCSICDQGYYVKDATCEKSDLQTSAVSMGKFVVAFLLALFF